MTRGWWLCGAFLLGACGPEVSSDELVADPESYVGESFWISGSPGHDVACTLVGCDPGASPCNSCGGHFRYGEEGNAIFIRDDGALPAPIWTRESPLLGASGVQPGEYVEGIGCRGNEEAVSCAPSVPARIEALHGTLRPNEFTGFLEFVVDDVRLARGPREQVIWDGRLLMEEAEYEGARPGS